MMVALPVQKAMTVALADDGHVETQRKRYNSRRASLKPALITAGFTIDESAAGLYLWCTRQEDSWQSVDWLASLGILATPGSFYGSDGSQHIRIALTATDQAIADASSRILAAVRG
jgi:aspartate/methionine/tyrosine aminotransferase